MCFYNGSPGLFKNHCIRAAPSRFLAMQHICRHHYMIKLIKITITYIKWTYTIDKHNLIIGMPLLQEWWRWHCYSHPDYLCLNIEQVNFDYSTLEAQISKIKNDRNKQISDSESRHLVDYIWVRWRSICIINIYVQRDAQKHYFIYPRTTLICITILDLPWTDICFLMDHTTMSTFLYPC